MTRVLVSYATEDSDTAERMVVALRDVGFDVRFAPHDLVAGDRLEWVFDQIRNVEVVVVLISNSATASRWARKELLVAIAEELA